MTVIVTTKSGSEYTFYENEGKIYIVSDKGRGILVSPVHPNRGAPMEIVFNEENWYTSTVSSDESYIKTTPVVDVLIY